MKQYPTRELGDWMRAATEARPRMMVATQIFHAPSINRDWDVALYEFDGTELRRAVHSDAMVDKLAAVRKALERWAEEKEASDA